MPDSAEHLDAIRRRFTPQAAAYVRMRQTTDEAALQGLVSGATGHDELMEASLDVDRTGLCVRREHDRLCFTHTAIAFGLRAAGGGSV